MSSQNGFVVEQVWRHPVKSLGGERIERSYANVRGLIGDRLWAVTDADGKLGSGKNSRRFRRMVGLLDVASRYPAAPDSAAPVVVGPDGREYAVASGAADEFLCEHIGRPDLRVRRESEVSHFDEVPLSLIGTATLAWLRAELPGVPIEARRFRVNLVVRTEEPFTEESWLGRTLRFGPDGEGVRAVFDRVLQRCVMVGMAQPGLTESGAVLKRLGDRDERSLCLALGGQILRGGSVRCGDAVAVD